MIQVIPLIGATITSLSYFIYKSSDLPYDIENDFKVNDIDKINDYKYLLLKKEDLENVYKNIINSNKNFIVVTIDDNINLEHPKSVKGIIDTKIKFNGLERKVDSFFLPMTFQMDTIDKFFFLIKNKENLILKELINYEETLNELREKNQLYYIEDYILPLAKISRENNNEVFINESFGKYIYFKDNEKLNLNNNLTKFKDLIEKYDQENKNLILILNENKNLTIFKSQGNNLFYDNSKYKINELLINYLQRLFNYDYSLIQEYSKLMSFLIKSQIFNNINLLNNNTEVNLYLENLKKLAMKEKINYEMLIDLTIKDYLIHYQKTSLLGESINLKNNNLFIVEAINHKTINKNLDNLINFKLEEDLDKYKKIKLELNNLNLNKHLQYSNEDILKINNFKEKYLSLYPEVFKISNYGTISNFKNHNFTNLKLGIDGHNTIGLTSFIGTSASTPEELINLITNKINDFEIYEKEFIER